MRPVERWVHTLTQPVTVMIYLFGVIGVYFLVDQPLASRIHSAGIDQHYPVLNAITLLGKSVIWLVVLPLIALYLHYSHKSKQLESRILFLWGALIIANVSCFVLKLLLGRARPELLFSDHTFGFFGFQLSELYHSFPSGHTSQVTALVLSLSLLYPKQRGYSLSLGVLILATRVLLTKHYLTDVLATVLLIFLEFRLIFYIVAQQCPFYWKKLGLHDE